MNEGIHMKKTPNPKHYKIQAPKGLTLAVDGRVVRIEPRALFIQHGKAENIKLLTGGIDIEGIAEGDYVEATGDIGGEVWLSGNYQARGLLTLDCKILNHAQEKRRGAISP